MGCVAFGKEAVGAVAACNGAEGAGGVIVAGVVGDRYGCCEGEEGEDSWDVHF